MTQEELVTQACPSQVARLELAQEVGDRPEERGNLSDSELERKIKEYGGEKENLPVSSKAKFDTSSEP